MYLETIEDCPYYESSKDLVILRYSDISDFSLVLLVVQSLVQGLVQAKMKHLRSFIQDLEWLEELGFSVGDIISTEQQWSVILSYCLIACFTPFLN